MTDIEFRRVTARMVVNQAFPARRTGPPGPFAHHGSARLGWGFLGLGTLLQRIGTLSSAFLGTAFFLLFTVPFHEFAV